MFMLLRLNPAFAAIRRFSEFLLPFSLLLVLTLLILAQPAPVRFLQTQVFDQYNRLLPRRESKNSPVIYLDIDEASIRRLGQFPWPRALFAQLAARAREGGAAALVFDILFSEPDRTAPRDILPVWSELFIDEGGQNWPDMQRRILRAIPDPDQLLAREIAKIPTVIPMALGGAGTRMPAPKTGIALHSAHPLHGHAPLEQLPIGKTATANLEPIERAARGLGVINTRLAQDGVIRHADLVFRGREDTLYPSLAVEALRVAQGAGSILLKASDVRGEGKYASGLGLSRLKVGHFIAPIEADGSMRLYFAKRRDLVRIPLWEVLAPDFDVTRLKGRIVFVGASAVGVGHSLATPLEANTPSVELHVQIAQQLIGGAHLRRPLNVLFAEAGAGFAIGLILLLLSIRFGVVPAALTMLIAIAFGFNLSLDYFENQLLLIDPLMPSLALFLTLLTNSTLNYLRTATEKQEVRAAFRQYVSPALIEQIARDPKRLKLGGETRPLSLMFADIRGFTHLSELYSEEPEKLTYILNVFLTSMSRIIQGHAGTIDKYIGDCIMAFWNAPTDVEAHAWQACRAAWQMQRALADINAQLRQDAELAARQPTPLTIGIGLNSGETLVGNVGSEQRFNYSAMGDTVNIAARLESQTKHYRVGILLGERCYHEAQTQMRDQDGGRDDFTFVELDRIALRGKARATRIYTLCDAAMMRADWHAQWLNAYYREQWEVAAKMAQDGQQRQDALAAYFGMMAARIERLRRGCNAREQ